MSKGQTAITSPFKVTAKEFASLCRRFKCNGTSDAQSKLKLGRFLGVKVIVLK